MLNAARTAQLAMLVEATSGPKPGNVDRGHDHDDTTLHDFVAGGVGALPALERAEEGGAVGELFYDAVEGAHSHDGGNTHFGALLLLVPLVAASGTRDVDEVVESTTVDDAVSFYDAFGLVDVHVGEPVEGLPDVREEAEDVLRESGITLYEVMERSASVDGVAAEWVNGFERCSAAADYLDYYFEGDTNDAVCSAYVRLLSEEPDTFVAKKHGDEVACSVSERAEEALERREYESFDDELVEEGINPGTTADIVCAGLFINLWEGEGGFGI